MEFCWCPLPSLLAEEISLEMSGTDAIVEEFDDVRNADGGIRPSISSEGTNKLLVEEPLDSSCWMVESLETSKGSCASTFVC